LIWPPPSAPATSRKACPWREEGPIYLLGTDESVETPMVSLTRHSRESGNPVLQGSNRWPWTPAFAGATE
jgi:hypothetical protein